MNRNRLIPFAYMIFLFAAGCRPVADARIAATEIPSESMTPPPTATDTAAPSASCISDRARREAARVTNVIDGDTIDVDEGGVPFRVRYVGVDAPEMVSEPMAAESLAANQHLLAGKEIVMIRDQSEADRYGRLLRFVFAGGTFVNYELTRLGMARAAPYPPDLSCQAEFAAAQREALQAGRGLWSIVLSLTPPPGAGAACAGGCVTPPAGCLIKGNISSGGQKIYHLPGGKFYDSTVIEPEKGERWFCSEAEAVAAGWRRSKQ
jgi:micrococcal nuclease